MDATERELALGFLLLKNGLPFDGAKLHIARVSTNDSVAELREEIQKKSAPELDNINITRVDVYATADLTREDAKRLLADLRNGHPFDFGTRIPLPELDLLGDLLPERLERASLHLIVDCTAASYIQAGRTENKANSRRLSDPIVDNFRRLQQGEAKMDSSAEHSESEANYITPTPSLSEKLRRQAKARSELTVMPKKRKDETDLDYAYRVKETLGWTPRLGEEGGTFLSEQNAEFLRKKDLEGIDLRNESRFIDRHEKVDRLYQKLQEEIVVLIRSPPMSGKTSLAQLLERKALKEQFEVYHGKLRVIRISLIWTRTSNMDWNFTEEFQWLMGGLSWEEFIEECNHIKTLLIIDRHRQVLENAKYLTHMDINFAIHQYLYSPDGTPDNSYHGGEALWAKVKFAQQLGRPMIALFSTYGYRAAYRNNRQSVISPIRIQGSWSLEELRYTREEYDTVVQMLYQVDFIGTLVPDELTDLSDHVWNMTLGHPGLVAFTFRNIYQHFREFQRRDITSPKPVTFIEIFDYTKSNLFYLALEADARAIQSLDKLTPDEQDFCDRVFRNPGQALEMTHHITTMVFDKTGTVTTGKPTVQDIWTIESHNEMIRKIVSCVVRTSTHPLSRAIYLELSPKEESASHAEEKQTTDPESIGMRLLHSKEIAGSGVIAGIHLLYARKLSFPGIGDFCRFTVHVGNEDWIKQQGGEYPAEILEDCQSRIARWQQEGPQ